MLVRKSLDHPNEILATITLLRRSKIICSLTITKRHFESCDKLATDFKTEETRNSIAIKNSFCVAFLA